MGDPTQTGEILGMTVS